MLAGARTVAERTSRAALLTRRLDRHQAGPGHQPVSDDRRGRMRVRHERCHADGHRAACGGRPGRHGQPGGTVAGTQLLSVRVVPAVEPRDRANREQHQRREHQMDHGHPEYSRIGAAGEKATD